MATIATNLGIPKYNIWANPNALEEFDRLKRKTLFMALSDGARIDMLRHSNTHVLTNEQLVVATQVDRKKWKDLLQKLRDELSDPQAKFELIYLIDDFMGTGSTFLRYEENAWTGKLIRFRDSLCEANNFMGDEAIFDIEGKLCVHHYIASSTVATSIKAREMEARRYFGEKNWFENVIFTFGMTLPSNLPITADQTTNTVLIELTQKYYNPNIRNPHTDVGGETHLGLGYGGCALPLVLEHNTPNNSIALLWAETESDPNNEEFSLPAMRPLFRRRQRHL